VLASETAGVSIAILQLVVAAGSMVVATTSRDDKAARSRALDLTHRTQSEKRLKDSMFMTALLDSDRRFKSLSLDWCCTAMLAVL